MLPAILITQAGSVTGINLLLALAPKQRYRLIAVDADPLAPGLYLADEAVLVPKTSADDYLDTLLDLCRLHQVKVLLPGHADELALISRNAARFRVAGVNFAVAQPNVLEILEDKQLMGNFLAAQGFEVPKEYALTALEQAEFPLFVKTRRDIGYKQTAKVRNPDELKSVLQITPEPFVQEFIEGPEYTVDVLSDLSGRVLRASPRQRLAVQNGICVKGITVKNPVLADLAAACVETFPLPGVSNVQIILNNQTNRPCLIEVNPRFAAGGLPLTIAAGLDLPEILIKLLLGEPCNIPKPQAGVVMLRYWDTLCLRPEQLKTKNHSPFEHKTTGDFLAN